MQKPIPHIEADYQQLYSLYKGNKEFRSAVLKLKKEGNNLLTFNHDGMPIPHSYTPGFRRKISQLAIKFNLSSVCKRFLELRLRSVTENLSFSQFEDLAYSELYFVDRSNKDIVDAILNGDDDCIVLKINMDTTIKDLQREWPWISKRREDILQYSYGKIQSSPSVSKNMERDLYVQELREIGNTYKEIASTINKDPRFQTKPKISYNDVSKILQRIKNKTNKET